MNRIFNEHVRLDQDEEDELLRLCETLRCSKSDVFRRLLKYKIVYGKPPLEYGKLIAELRKIGTNLNQIARALNANGYFIPEDFSSVIDRLNATEDILYEAFTPGKEG